MTGVPPSFFRQSGVVAVREIDGREEVLLVSSRGGKRWVIPKGVVEEGLTPAESAVNEAWEEAGIRGRVGAKPLGAYDYLKWGGTCTVEVYPFRVAEVLDEWPESSVRQRKWLSREEAAAAVEEGALSALIMLSGVSGDGGR